LGDLFFPHRILVVNLNLLTIFCIFYYGKYIFENLIFQNNESVCIKDEYLPDNKAIPSITESLKNDFDTMTSDFEEYSRKRNPTFVFKFKNN
jgi:hypothetical protein